MGASRDLSCTALVGPDGHEDINKDTTLVPVDPASLQAGSEVDTSRLALERVEGQDLVAHTVSNDPKVVVVPHALSAEECAHIVDLTEGSFETDAASSSCCLRPWQTGIVERVERRLSSLAGIPMSHMEKLIVHKCLPNEVADMQHLIHSHQLCLLMLQLVEWPLSGGGELEMREIALRCLPRRGAAMLWPCLTPDGEVDTRLLHRLAPASFTSYMLVCSFHKEKVRLVLEPDPDTSLSDAYHIDIRKLVAEQEAAAATASEETIGRSTLRIFALGADPKVKAASTLLHEADVDKLLSMLPAGYAQDSSSSNGAQTLINSLTLKQDGLAHIQARVEMLLGSSSTMSSVRMVQAAAVPDLCSRSCGVEAVYISLSEQEDVFFPKLGFRVTLRAGDALLIPNVYMSADHPVEDVRGIRCHLQPPSDNGEATTAAVRRPIGLEVNFSAPYVPIEVINPSPQLCDGLALRVGDVSCQVRKPVGMGSFGAVWSASLEGGDAETDTVVIKEVVSDSRSLAEAIREVRLLKLLVDKSESDDVAGSQDLWQRLPRLLSSQQEKVRSRPQLWRTRLAMTEVRGMPLDHFLAQHSEQSCSSDASATKGTAAERLANASSFASALLLQLAPVMQYLSKYMLHRDVNAHNILIAGGLEQPHFALVDFGLAVELGEWRARSGRLSACNADVGGDCRYWPMSAWIQMVCGWSELVKYPQLSWEYETHIDFQGLGITALQTYHHLLCPTGNCADDSGFRDDIVEAQRAWEGYWAYASSAWQRVFAAFKTGSQQGIDDVKLQLLQEAVYNNAAKTLSALRGTWRSLGKATAAEKEEVTLPPGKLVAAILELVSAGGVVGVIEGHAAPAWQVVSEILLDGSFTSLEGGLTAALLQDKC